MSPDTSIAKTFPFARHATAALVAAVVSGCATVGPEFTRPEAAVAEAWQEADNPTFQPESDDHQNWWMVFNDQVLNTLIKTAYEQNLGLRIAGIRILEARAQLGIAVGGLYPQQQALSGSVSSQSGSENAANTIAGDLNFTNYNLGFDVAWEIDFWGKFRRGIESADANLLASVADYDDLLVTLTAEVANTYLVTRTFEERLRIARENVKIQKRSVEIANARFKGGLTTELDLQQAMTLHFSTQASIPRLETGLRQARNALSTLLGKPPGEVDRVLGQAGKIPSAPAEVAVGLPNELLRRRPDVRGAELQAAAQSSLIGVAKSDLYPSFSLFGSVGLLAAGNTDSTRTGNSGSSQLFKSDSVFYVGGPQFTWPIFNYGRIKNSVRVQDARLQQLLANYQNVVLGAAREAEDAMTAFVRSRDEVAYRAHAAKAARRSVDLALIQYREGATDYTTVLNTQQSLVSQQDQLTSTRGDVVRNLVALYKALGGGWQLRGSRPFVPEPTQSEMRQRTDWGRLLAPPGSTDLAPTGKKTPDW